MKIIKIANLETTYTGIMSPESHNQGIEAPWSGLLNKFDIPEGWTTHAHHMTLNLGESKSPELLGQEVTINVKALGKDENAIALLVDTNIPSKNDKTHITLATAPHADPVASNDIENWTPINNFQLKGVICEVGPGGKIISETDREQERIRKEKEQELKRQKELEKNRKRQEENEKLQQMGFEGAKSFLKQQFPNLPEQAILGKLRGAGLS